MPSSVTADVAPDVHRCRQNGVGGGVSVVYCHPCIQVALVEMKSPSATTDRLVIKLNTRRAGRINLAALYRPPSSSTYGAPVSVDALYKSTFTITITITISSFCTEFADFLDELLLLPGQPVISKSSPPAFSHR